MTGLRENRDLEGRHRFYRFRTPLRGRTHRFYWAPPFLFTKCNRNVTETSPKFGVPTKRVGSYPTISVSIPAPGTQIRSDPANIIDFDANGLFSATFPRLRHAEGDVTVM